MREIVLGSVAESVDAELVRFVIGMFRAARQGIQCNQRHRCLLKTQGYHEWLRNNEL